MNQKTVTPFRKKGFKRSLIRKQKAFLSGGQTAKVAKIIKMKNTNKAEMHHHYRTRYEIHIERTSWLEQWKLNVLQEYKNTAKDNWDLQLQTGSYQLERNQEAAIVTAHRMIMNCQCVATVKKTEKSSRRTRYVLTLSQWGEFTGVLSVILVIQVQNGLLLPKADLGTRYCDDFQILSTFLSCKRRRFLGLFSLTKQRLWGDML